MQDFAEVIVGEDPMNIEKIWDTIFRKTFWGLGGGTVINAAISAIDIALWDIKGKALGVPVWQLLGGKTNDDLRVYASQLQFNWGANAEKQMMITPDDYAAATRLAIEDGYDAVKVDPIIFSDQPDGKGPWRTTGPLESRVINTVVDRITAMREAGGPDMDIILEHHSLSDTVSAVQIGKALEHLRIYYYEEPVHPLNSKSMLEIKQNLNIPIAAGERIYTRFGYRPFFEDRSIHVIQPDICLCGGITEAKKICDMGLAYDAKVQIHICRGPISRPPRCRSRP
ncbi:MAG: mandelate racemase/muconate lactonizing enzyme family protein [Burkholderiaceae bacterium]